jgi:hypothetical protein
MDSIPPPPQLDTDNTTIATTMSNGRITLSTLTLLTLISMVTVIIIEYRVSAAEEDDTTVLLKTVDAGTFLGVKVDLSSSSNDQVDPNSIPKSYFAFKGIPYAKAPLGPKLRWTEPLPTNILDKPKVATQFKPPCSQWDSVRGKPIGSQDCLHINVFTPFVPMGGGCFITILFDNLFDNFYFI